MWEAGCGIKYVDVAEQDIAQLDPLAADLLVVLDGPIGVNDHAAYPVVTQEIELLKARLAADRPILGICLGAQMIAAGLGAMSILDPRRRSVGRRSNSPQLATPSVSLAMLRPDAELHRKGLEEAGANLLTGWLARLS